MFYVQFCFSSCVLSCRCCQVIRKAPEEMEPGRSHQHEAQLVAVAADPGGQLRPDLQQQLSAA
jgi:hypothetical protein